MCEDNRLKCQRQDCNKDAAQQRAGSRARGVCVCGVREKESERSAGDRISITSQNGEVTAFPNKLGQRYRGFCYASQQKTIFSSEICSKKRPDNTQ